MSNPYLGFYLITIFELSSDENDEEGYDRFNIQLDYEESQMCHNLHDEMYKREIEITHSWSSNCIFEPRF
jgi:hypothetical protein